MQHFSVLSEIKHQVEESRSRNKYREQSVKKVDRFFSLYLNQVILIQRSYRRHLLRKTRTLRKVSSESVSTLCQNRDKNKSLREKLKDLEVEQNMLSGAENTNPNIAAGQVIMAMQSQAKQSIKQVVEEADRCSKIKVFFKNQLKALKDARLQANRLRGQIHKSNQAMQSYALKNEKTEQQIRNLRCVIRYEKNQGERERCQR